MTVPEGWDGDLDDPVAVEYFSLPEVGLPPRPCVDGVDEKIAKVVQIVAAHAWRFAGKSLGTNYSYESALVAERLGYAAGDLLLEGDPIDWARACAWVVADRHGLMAHDLELPPQVLAREMGTKEATMAKLAERLREALPTLRSRRPREDDDWPV
ncbi:hypothetical protein [Nocardia sp. NPDC050406]|uniref:hypothetical protein n=1 Tax=Nocardia sp. NPDC050406 TaxID=3364318 RepID=UPI00379CE1EF